MNMLAFKLQNLFLATAMIAMASCSDSVIEGIAPDANPLDDYVTNVNLEVEDFEYVGDGTRTQLLSSTDGLQFKWKQGDNIGVVPVKGYYDTYQNLEFIVDMDNSDGRNAKFANGGFMLKKDMSYAAYYPYSYETQNPYSDINFIPVSYKGQRQRYNYNTDHLGKYDYMAAAPVKSTDGSLTFNFQHFGTICHFHLTLPEIAENTELKTMYISFINSTNQTVKIPVVGLICDISSIGDLILHYNSGYEGNMDNCLKVELTEVLPDREKTVDLFAMMPFYLFNGYLEETPEKMQVTLVDAKTRCHTCIIDMPAKRDYSGKVLSFVNDKVYNTAATSVAGLSGKAFNDAIKEYIDPVAIKKVVFNKGVDFDYEGGYDIDLSNSSDVFKIKAKFDPRELILTVSTDANSIMLTDGFSMFEGFKSMTEIERLRNLDTSTMTSMASMFKNCKSLKTLDLSTFDNKHVHVFDEMFRGCTNLTKLEWSNKFFQNKENVYLEKMFSGCESLIIIDFGKYPYARPLSVVSMCEMFDGCKKLGYNVDFSLDMTIFNTSKVTDMHGLFRGCEKLKQIKAGPSFITESVTDMSYMFDNCKSISFSGDKVDISIEDFNTSNVTNMSYMFRSCAHNRYFNLMKIDTHNVVRMRGMFEGCTETLFVWMHGINTESLIDCSNMFRECTLMQKIYLDEGTFSKVTDTSGMFSNARNLNEIVCSNMALDPEVLSSTSFMFFLCGRDGFTSVKVNKSMKALIEDSAFRKSTYIDPAYMSFKYEE